MTFDGCRAVRSLPQKQPELLISYEFSLLQKKNQPAAKEQGAIGSAGGKKGAQKLQGKVRPVLKGTYFQTNIYYDPACWGQIFSENILLP